MNENIGNFAHRLPDAPGFFRLDGEPYWLDLAHGKKILYYIYVLGNPPYRSMPSERFPLCSKTLRDGAFAIMGIAKTTTADKLVVPEAMGYHVGGILSAITAKQFTPIYKETTERRYVDDLSKKEVEGRIAIRKATGYSVTEMSVYGLRRGDTVVLVDSILSTGGTALGIIKELKEHGIDVLDFATFITKVDYKGDRKIREQTGIEPKTLLNLSIRNVYEQNEQTYADTILKKSKWWHKGEAICAKLNEKWESLRVEISKL